MKERLTLALPKGRLLDDAIELLRELGVEGIDQDSRRLIFTDPRSGLRLLFLKPVDIPAYVLYGAAEILYRSGRDFNGAAQLLRRYLNGPEKTEDAPAFQAHYLLGEILEKQGDKPGAAEEYRAALALAPAYEQAQSALKRVSQ